MLFEQLHSCNSHYQHYNKPESGHSDQQPTPTLTHLRSLVNSILHGGGQGFFLVVQVIILDLALRSPYQLPRLNPLGWCWRFVFQILVIQFALHIRDVRNVMIQLLLTWNCRIRKNFPPMNDSELFHNYFKQYRISRVEILSHAQWVFMWYSGMVFSPAYSYNSLIKNYSLETERVELMSSSRVRWQSMNHNQSDLLEYR